MTAAQPEFGLLGEPVPHPSVDDLLGPVETKPTADALLGAPPRSSLDFTSGTTMEGPLWDSAFSTESPISHVLTAFGQGVKEGWGSSNGPPLSPETEEFLRKSGLWNDYKNGHTSFVKSLNEAFMRPLAAGVALGTGAFNAAIRGAQAIVAQTGAELGAPILGRDIAALPEALLPETPRFISPLAEARALNVIGPGDEAAWKGTAVEPIGSIDAHREAWQQEIAAAREAATDRLPEAVQETVASSPVPPPQGVDTVARQLRPDLFAEFDALGMRRDMLRRQLDDVSQHPAISAIDDQIGTLRAQRLEAAPAERRGMANQITDLEEQRQALVDQLDSTEERAQVRQDILDATHRMWDLAPEIREANRAAEANLRGGEPLAIPEAATTPISQGASELAPIAEQPPREPAPSIAQDVSRQLMAAGRPQEEADAVGALQAERYAARSANLTGTTPEQLYAEEAPAITAGRAGGKRGAITVGETRSTIRLFANSDASTAIHELGHSYLEELIRDSTDERATDSVSADADTVQKWLGVDEGESPTRAQHEKFARGFERYMMEGSAPSTALADVFAKFKQWLTAIYQTVGRLRSPISDDIRSVFDRMFAAPDHPTVITPELETAGFADRHETLAERTPAADAAREADLIRSEADKIAAEKVPDIHAELTGGTRSGSPGAGGNATADTGLDRDAVAAESVAGTDATARAVGEIGTGRGEAAAESNRVPRATTTEPTDPATAILPRADTRLVDKAGNIRLDNIETTEDFKQAIHDAAERNDDFLERRRGVVSDAQRMALANILGTTPDKVFNRGIGEAFSDSEIKLIERTLANSAANVHELSIKAAAGTDADVLAFTEAFLRHDMIQGIYSQATAEAGRALRSLRRSQEFWSGEALATNEIVRQGINDATGRTLYQMQQIAQRVSQLDQGPGPLSKFTRETLRPGVFDWIQSLFINALLSGPFTHAGYTVAGQLFGLFRGIGETSASAAIGGLRNLFGIGPTERASIEEVPHQLYGQLRGARSGVSAAWDSWKANRTVLPSEVEALNPIAGQAIGQQPIIPGRVGQIIESPSRMVAALHSFNWTTFYSQSIAGQAFRQAMSEGLQGQAFAARIADLTTTPTEGMIRNAIDDAGSGALVTRPSYDSLMGKLSRVTNTGYQVPDIPLPGGTSIPMGTLRPLKYIDPFVQIQANIQKAAFGRGTPLALFSQQVRDDLSFKNGGVAFDRQAGKILAGTGFMIAAGGLAAEGILNWSGPSEPNEARSWMRVFGLPHGLRIGDLSFDILRLGNLGLQMSVAADLFHVGAQAGDGDMNKAASDLVMAFAHNILDESFARGPAELMRAVDDHDRYGAQWMRSFTSSFLPFSVGLSQVAREIDPYSRQARTTIDAIKAKVPFLSETLTPKYDLWGQPVSNRGWAGTYYMPLKDDPIDSKMNSLGIYPSMPERRIVGVALTEEQYADYTRIAGRMAHLRVGQIIGQPGFSVLPDGTQREMIGKAISNSREAARTMIKMAPENRGIIDAATAAIKAKLHGEKPPAGGWPQTVH